MEEFKPKLSNWKLFFPTNLPTPWHGRKGGKENTTPKKNPVVSRVLFKRLLKKIIFGRKNMNYVSFKSKEYLAKLMNYSFSLNLKTT